MLATVATLGSEIGSVFTGRGKIDIGSYWNVTRLSLAIMSSLSMSRHRQSYEIHHVSFAASFVKDFVEAPMRRECNNNLLRDTE